MKIFGVRNDEVRKKKRTRLHVIVQLGALLV